MNFKVLILAAIALSIPVGSMAQISRPCSEMSGIYVLARGTYGFAVSGSCVYVDGHHSPYLTKAAYDALDPKPSYNIFFD